MAEVGSVALLSPRQRATVGALAEVLIPAGGGVPGAEEADVTAMVEALLAAMPGGLASRIRLLIDAWDAAPLMLVWARRRFHALGPAERDRVVKLAAGSPVTRIPYGYLKQIVFMAYGASPVVEEAIGFDHGCLAHGHDHR